MKPQIKYLSDSEIKEIHQHSLRILEEIGMRMPHEEALTVFKQAGAEIVDSDIVRIPEKLVDQALSTVPKRDQVVLFARD